MTDEVPSRIRCEWVPSDDPVYTDYHDREWGVPVHDDRKFFEFLTLEGAQAGLSWKTILVKRENYRNAMDNFMPEKVASYGRKKIDQLLSNQGIVRNKLKITSAVNNAQAFLKIVSEFGSFDSYLWRYVDGKPLDNRRKSIKEIPARTPDSDKLSNDLKKRGFRFVGSTIMYSFMQATGLVNDHTIDCFRHSRLDSYVPG